MKKSWLLWSAFFIAAGAWILLSSGCIMSDGGYGYDEGGYAGPGYYDSFGVEYGDWGPGYRVAPFRGGDHHRNWNDHRGGGGTRPGGIGGHSGGPSYHPAAGSRPTPSLPRGGGGGGRSGGSGAGRPNR
jgi:hypothetical protein